MKKWRELSVRDMVKGKTIMRRENPALDFITLRSVSTQRTFANVFCKDNKKNAFYFAQNFNRNLAL